MVGAVERKIAVVDDASETRAEIVSPGLEIDAAASRGRHAAIGQIRGEVGLISMGRGYSRVNLSKSGTTNGRIGHRRTKNVFCIIGVSPLTCARGN